MGKDYNTERDYNTETVQTRQYSSSGVSSKLTYLVVGGGIGAILALLFAPKSGTELRSDIADASRKGLDLTREQAQQLQNRSGEYYQQLRQQAGDLYNRANEAYSTASDRVRNRTPEDKAADYIENTASELSDDVREIGSDVRNQSNRLT